MLSKEQLKEIEKQTWDIIAVDADKRHLEKLVREIPVLLAHIDHLQRALEWMAKDIGKMKACSNCNACRSNCDGHINNGSKECAALFVQHYLNATKDTTND